MQFPKFSKLPFSGVSGRSEVRNTSILEIMLILVFVALVLLSEAYGENERLAARSLDLRDRLDEAEISQLERRELEDRYSALGQENDDLRSEIGSLNDALNTLRSMNALSAERQQSLEDSVKRLESALAPMEDLRQSLESVGIVDEDGRPRTSVDDLRQAVEGLQNAAGISGGTSLSETLRRASDALQNANAQEERRDTAHSAINDLRDAVGLAPDAPVPEVLSLAGDTIADLRSNLKEATSDYVRIRREQQELMDQIVGWLPCWPAEGSGNYHYTYNVYVQNSGVSVQPGWPDAYDSVVANTPALQISQMNMTDHQFELFGQQVKAYGQAQNNPCLFVVRLYESRNADRQVAVQRLVSRNFSYSVFRR